MQTRCSAVGFVKKLRGGAQAHLLRADDGNNYVVKFKNNPQHRRVLINELLASECLAYLGIETPHYALVNVSTQFLREHPDVAIQNGTRRQGVEPGLHFGSRCPSGRRIHDNVSDQTLSTTTNYSQFLAVFAFDRWTSNADSRQVIFCQMPGSSGPVPPAPAAGCKGLHALMIDNGYAFGGSEWNLIDSAIQGMFSRHIVYDAVTSISDFEPWLSRLAALPERVLLAAKRKIPEEWLEGDAMQLDALLARLQRRQQRISDLVLEVCESPNGPFHAFPRPVPRGTGWAARPVVPRLPTVARVLSSPAR